MDAKTRAKVIEQLEKDVAGYTKAGAQPAFVARLQKALDDQQKRVAVK